MIRKIFLVFKTHFDIGFTDLSSRVIDKYATQMLADVFATLQATEDMGALKYVWTMPAWPLKVVADRVTGEEARLLSHYIENGQIAWHALPFTSHTDFCGEEEYLEGLTYGKELSDRFHKPYPVSAKMTDVPGHGWMLPELLASSGIRFLHLGCNAFATPPDVPLLFWWESPGGKRILTMYNRGGYGSSLEAPGDWPYPVWMALMHTHDNSGPHSAEYIRYLEAKAKKLYPEAEVVCGTMDDFVRELEKYDLEGLPIVKKDLADTWIHGVGAYPRESALARGLRSRAEALQTMQMQKKLEKKADIGKERESLAACYESMHLFGEHTWGADVKTFLGPERVYEREEFEAARHTEASLFMEASWMEQSDRVRKCEEMLGKYEGAVHQKGDFLYNPSVKPYSGWIAKERDSSYTIEFFGKPHSYVKDLPPLTAVAGEGKLEPLRESMLKIERVGKGSIVENHRYRLEFLEESGVIVSLYDKKLKMMLLKERDGQGVFSFSYMRCGIQRMTDFLKAYGYRFHAWGVQDYGRENYPECETKVFAPRFDELKIEGSTIIFSYTGGEEAQNYGGAKKLLLSITLPPAGDEIFVEISLKGKQATPFIESGSFYLPLAGEPKRYDLNKNGTILNPKTDIENGANHVYYALEYGAAAACESGGVAVMAPDTPLMSIGEEGCYLYREQYERTNPQMVFNLFNNMWGTNFPQWIEGDFTFRFILFGYEKREELLECFSQRARGIVGTDAPIARLDLTLPEGMELVTIKPQKNGMKMIVRELYGEEGEEKLLLPEYVIGETDFYGRRLGKSYRDLYSFRRRKYGLYQFLAEKVNTEDEES